MVTTEVRIDRQGRVVIPRADRERLGVRDGGVLELVSTPEGVQLERRRRVEVAIAEDGVPLVTVEDVGTVRNDDAVGAIHRQRDGA